MKNSMLRKSIESKEVQGSRRKYLSMSGIGNECLRALWFSFRWATPKISHEAREERIFRRGDMEEARIITDLKSVGVEVFRRDPDGSKHEITGLRDEQEELVGFIGHALGHPDGRAKEIPDCPDDELTLEMKTMNDENFDNLVRFGIQNSHPSYYFQSQRYMKGMGTPATLLVATNKNDEEREYIFIGANKDVQEELIWKEKQVITNEVPFRAPWPKGHYKCSFCSHKEVCRGLSAPEKNCRTCEHIEIHENGVWKCGLDKKELDVKAQEKGCFKHKRIF